MKRGTSMWVGQARVQGASTQLRQRAASMAAACGAKGGLMSANSVAVSMFAGIALCLGEVAIQVGATVAVKLPGLAHLADFIEVEIGGEHFVLRARSLGDDLAA